MPRRMQIKKKRTAPAVIIFASAKNERNKTQSCIYASCVFSGQRVGPVWGHEEQSVRRALAELTAQCECPAVRHTAQEFEGHRLALR